LNLNKALSGLGLKVKPGVALLTVMGIAYAFVGENYWLFTVAAGMILGISALGLMVVIGWGKEVSLAQAALTGTAAYITGYAYREDGWGLPFMLAMLVATAVVVGLSLVVALGTAKMSGLYIMVLTLGLQFMLEKTVFTSRALTGGISAINIPRPWFFGIDMDDDRNFYLFVFACVGLLIFALGRFRNSVYGRAMMLVGSDRKAAAAAGISPWRYKVLAFAMAGFFAGVAGALTAPLFRNPPLPLTFGAFYSLLYLSIPVVAGFQSLWGVIVVAVVFTVVPVALESAHVSPFILAGVGLLAGILSGPRGVSGALFDFLGLVKRKVAGAPETNEIVLSDAEDLERRRACLETLEAFIPKREETSPALTATGISLAFGGLKALSEVDVTVPTRQFVGLLGPNGAGKSTLFDVMNGLRAPDEGEIRLFGKDVTKSTAWDRATLGMSRTFQANRINGDLSVGENLLIGCTKVMDVSLLGAILRTPKARAEEARAVGAARAVAELLGILEHWDTRAGELNFGAQRRIEIGRSLLNGPRVLLLDEPAAGLDIEECDVLFEVVQRLRADLGLTVILVEHYVKAVLENADLVYVLNQGRLLAVGTPEEIAANPEVRAEYLGAEMSADLSRMSEEHVDA
jgi:ABC-type branched-subunit amino acid transport system ATPase component/ABC-type branched-subunit amino acid transport system permease subunit